ncbi:hypothetical protein DYB25_006731 [Aphanomyces astaci]|uniref:Uncharacterized protein n=1 Tax=Aphanomyces astaci TaxID=112090 RepID=A0A396ZSU4_APHAT|nr:hypothetical protein DYB25_006731 [Aphanomyces astaci]
MQTYSADEWTLRGLAPAPTTFSPAYVAHLNTMLRSKSAAEIVAWAANSFGKSLALSSSFGIQSAVMLHLVTQHANQPHRVPVVWVDTGYLPPETYTFATALQQSLDLNLRVYHPQTSPAHMEAMHGKLYESSSPEDHQLYGLLRKVEPMERALAEMGATALLVGLRADQTDRRRRLDIVHVHNGRLKICPILSWTQHDVDTYMARHNLPFHPLKALGYATVGDAHSSRPMTEADTDIRATRFHGRAQECGLHAVDTDYDDDADAHEAAQDLPYVDAIVYSKPQCKYCVLAKEALSNAKWSYRVLTVGVDITLRALCALVGADVTSVPQVFVRGQYIGGYNDLHDLLHRSTTKKPFSQDDTSSRPGFHTNFHITHSSTLA